MSERGPPPSAFSYAASYNYKPGNPDPLPRRPRSRAGSIDSVRSTSAVPAGGSQRPQSSFRPAFQAPSSRASSVIWAPPSPTASSANLAITKAPNPSTRLHEKLGAHDKPWLTQPQTRERVSWWLTFFWLVIGAGVAALICFRAWQDTNSIMLNDADLCQVFADDFSSGSISTDFWDYDVGLGGWGNNEFQIYSSNSKNSFVQNGQLYILPTLTSDEVGGVDKLSSPNFTYVVPNCASSNNQAIAARAPQQQTGGNNGNNGQQATPTQSGGRQASSSAPSGSASSSQPSATSSAGSSSGNACVATSNGNNIVIPPVKSARLVTRGKKGIIDVSQPGRVEVRAKLPRGDWLWPAIWMLPVNKTYGGWPMSGEIDIMEARGNRPDYPAQGSNFVRSSLNYGPLSSTSSPDSPLTGQAASLLTSIFGWWEMKRGGYDEDFHTYTLEFESSWMRVYVDNRLQGMLNLRTRNDKESYWSRGKYPATAFNGTGGQEVVVSDPWFGKGPNAPFDQQFYLIINVAAGGTSGWFPDGAGNKPWRDESQTAMRDFLNNQSTWSATWPTNNDDRAFRIDSVKMWNKCR